MFLAREIFSDFPYHIRLTAKKHDFDAVVVVEMGMHGGDDIFMVLMLLFGQLRRQAALMMVENENDRRGGFSRNAFPFTFDKIVADKPGGAS